MEVGTVLYREITRKNQVPEIRSYKVEKVGRIYFYVQGIRHKINIKTLKHQDPNYNSFNFQMYRSEEEIFALRDFENLDRKVCDFFRDKYSRSGLNIEQLKEIDKIINPNV